MALAIFSFEPRNKDGMREAINEEGSNAERRTPMSNSPSVCYFSLTPSGLTCHCGSKMAGWGHTGHDAHYPSMWLSIDHFNVKLAVMPFFITHQCGYKSTMFLSDWLWCHSPLSGFVAVRWQYLCQPDITVLLHYLSLWLKSWQYLCQPELTVLLHYLSVCL